MKAQENVTKIEKLKRNHY